MLSFTAGAPTGENSKSQVIHHKTKQKLRKVAQHNNTMLRFIQILAVLPVITSHIATGMAVQGHRPTCIK